jgi:hypothetical protein
LCWDVSNGRRGARIEGESAVKNIRIGLHSFMLMLADFAGIFGVFVVFKTFDFEQLLTQLSLAAGITILLFWVWFFLLRALGGQQFVLLELRELLFVFLAAMALNLAIFVSLHYFTRGSLADNMNLVLLAFYQLPVNLIALCGVWILQN